MVHPKETGVTFNLAYKAPAGNDVGSVVRSTDKQNRELAVPRGLLVSSQYQSVFQYEGGAKAASIPPLNGSVEGVYILTYRWLEEDS